VLIPKKFLTFLAGLSVIALILIIWRETSRITGDVSVAGSDGAAVALSGAGVTLYKVTEEQGARLAAAVTGLRQQNQQEKDTNARVFPAESSDPSVRSTLAGYNNLSDTKECFALEKVVDEIRKSAVRKQTTDGHGHFGFRALPGRYVFEIVGQAGDQRVMFIEQVEPKWHTHFNLSDPSCHYTLTN
jgi:hypothetical protein